MNSALTASDIRNCYDALISRNTLWNKKDLFIYYIINQTAGCFKHKKKSKIYKKILNDAQIFSEKVKVCVNSITSSILLTNYTNHAKELAAAVVNEIKTNLKKNAEYLIVAAGGDGTSLEVQSELFNIAQQNEENKKIIKNHLTILRLPLGTGNDGTDGHSIQENLDLLQTNLEFTNSPAVKVYPESEPDEQKLKNCRKKPEKYESSPSKAPWYAFNIASIGLDAYVVYMTNVFKERMPGNFYHLCIPFAGIFYDKDLPTGTASIQFFDEKGKLTDGVTCPLTLLAFGASGNRVYGGGHKVLPDEHNVCYAPKVSLLTLMKENHRFVDGSFIGKDFAFVKNAKKVRIYYDQPILLQCDGEISLIRPAQFPLIFEITEPVLRTLKKV